MIEALAHAELFSDGVALIVKLDSASRPADGA